ncbi:MAG: hypothetical protein V9G14_13955 [Cypionkella sp.]
MTLISPISAGSPRQQVVPSLATSLPQVLAVTPVAPVYAVRYGPDPPEISGITLDHIPFIGDEATLIDDLPQAPKMTAKAEPSENWSLSAAAARSYLEAKALTGQARDSEIPPPGQG